MKSGNLNFLEPSGPLQACNGTALAFTFLVAGRWPHFNLGTSSPTTRRHFLEGHDLDVTAVANCIANVTVGLFRRFLVLFV
jgi:hypothetical protein